MADSGQAMVMLGLASGAALLGYFFWPDSTPDYEKEAQQAGVNTGSAYGSAGQPTTNNQVANKDGNDVANLDDGSGGDGSGGGSGGDGSGGGDNAKPKPDTSDPTAAPDGGKIICSDNIGFLGGYLCTDTTACYDDDNNEIDCPSYQQQVDAFNNLVKNGDDDALAALAEANNYLLAACQYLGKECGTEAVNIVPAAGTEKYFNPVVFYEVPNSSTPGDFKLVPLPQDTSACASGYYQDPAVVNATALTNGFRTAAGLSPLPDAPKYQCVVYDQVAGAQGVSGADAFQPYTEKSYDSYLQHQILTTTKSIDDYNDEMDTYNSCAKDQKTRQIVEAVAGPIGWIYGAASGDFSKSKCTLPGGVSFSASNTYEEFLQASYDDPTPV